MVLLSILKDLEQEMEGVCGKQNEKGGGGVDIVVE